MVAPGLRPAPLAVGLAACVLLGLAGASPARAQTGCNLRDSRTARWIAAGGGTRIFFVGGPAYFECDGGIRIWADSAEHFEATNELHLIGDVRYVESDQTLLADRLNYFRGQERIIAWGNVEVDDTAQGSTITGDTLRYLRAARGRRDEQITVTGERPHAVLRMSPGSTTRDSVPSDTAVVDTAVVDTAAVDTAAVDTTGAEEAGAPPDTAAPDSARLGEIGREELARILRERRGQRPDTLAPGDTLPADTAVSDTAAADTAVVDTVRSPYEVDADRIFLLGDAYFEATGDAVITRDELTAYGDTAIYRQAEGRLVLSDSVARVVARGYELEGRTVTMRLPGDVLEHVTARPRARLVGEGFGMRSPEIRLFVTPAGSLDRLVAVREGGFEGRGGRTPGEARTFPGPEDLAGDEGGGEGEGRRGEAADSAAGWPERPEADAEGFLLRSDSMEVLTPNEVLDRLIAVGNARGESTEEDTGRLPPGLEDPPELVRRDWLEGDTITGHFVEDSSAVTSSDSTDDGADRVSLETLVATGSARSFYRMAPRREEGASAGDEGDGAGACVSLHYVVGTEIRIRFAGGEPEVVRVRGGTRGQHLEPICAPGEDADTTVTGDGTGGRR